MADIRESIPFEGWGQASGEQVAFEGWPEPAEVFTSYGGIETTGPLFEGFAELGFEGAGGGADAAPTLTGQSSLVFDSYGGVSDAAPEFTGQSSVPVPGGSTGGIEVPGPVFSGAGAGAAPSYFDRSYWGASFWSRYWGALQGEAALESYSVLEFRSYGGVTVQGPALEGQSTTSGGGATWWSYGGIEVPGPALEGNAYLEFHSYGGVAVPGPALEGQGRLSVDHGGIEVPGPVFGGQSEQTFESSGGIEADVEFSAQAEQTFTSHGGIIVPGPSFEGWQAHRSRGGIEAPRPAFSGHSQQFQRAHGGGETRTIIGGWDEIKPVDYRQPVYSSHGGIIVSGPTLQARGKLGFESTQIVVADGIVRPGRIYPRMGISAGVGIPGPTFEGRSHVQNWAIYIPDEEFLRMLGELDEELAEIAKLERVMA